MREEKFEFEINDSEIIEHFKEIITPKNKCKLDLFKLEEDIKSKMVEVEQMKRQLMYLIQ